uniref:Putative secreted protein n=1 Tax=Panstrongylus lignarius TaxID=156445 RepID=A0A224XY09_9HEMI
MMLFFLIHILPNQLETEKNMGTTKSIVLIIVNKPVGCIFFIWIHQLLWDSFVKLKQILTIYARIYEIEL